MISVNKLNACGVSQMISRFKLAEDQEWANIILKSIREAEFTVACRTQSLDLLSFPFSSVPFIHVEKLMPWLSTERSLLSKLFCVHDLDTVLDWFAFFFTCLE